MRVGDDDEGEVAQGLYAVSEAGWENGKREVSGG